MRIITLWAIAAGIMTLLGCDTVVEPDQDNTSKEPFEEIVWEQDVTGQLQPWELFQNPDHTPASQIDFMDDNEMVFVTKLDGKVFAYPLRFMLIEVVNVESGGVYAAITYCPLTKSSVAWNRLVGADTLLLTASGYLLRDNLMPLDLNSGSIWSQMRLVGMHGRHDKVNIETLPMFETSWKTLKSYFPDASVFTQNRNNKSAWVESGEVFSDRQFAILGRNQVEVFDTHLFSGEIVLHSTLVQPGGSVVVAGSSEHQYVVAFQTNYGMHSVEGEFPIIMRDESGTGWNIFGEAVDGERKGEQLDSPTFYTAAAWAWETLFATVSDFNPS